MDNDYVVIIVIIIIINKYYYECHTVWKLLREHLTIKK